MQAKFEATLATETLITSEEAVIAAASAEAVTLAKAALKFAKDAALLNQNNHSIKADNTSAVSSEVDALHFNWVQHMKTDQTGMVVEPMGADSALLEDHSMHYTAKGSDDLEPNDEELELLQEQLTNSIAVRSSRQTERKARRAIAAERAAASVVSVKPGSTSRKKRALQDVDYSDPLRYLRTTTSTSKLLTATEELELSEGIQVSFTPESF